MVIDLHVMMKSELIWAWEITTIETTKNAPHFVPFLRSRSKLTCYREPVPQKKKKKNETIAHTFSVSLLLFLRHGALFVPHFCHIASVLAFQFQNSADKLLRKFDLSMTPNKKPATEK